MPCSKKQLPVSPHPQIRHLFRYDREIARLIIHVHPIPRRRRPEKFKNFSETNPFGPNHIRRNRLYLLMDNTIHIAVRVATFVTAFMPTDSLYENSKYPKIKPILS